MQVSARAQILISLVCGILLFASTKQAEKARNRVRARRAELEAAADEAQELYWQIRRCKRRITSLEWARESRIARVQELRAKLGRMHAELPRTSTPGALRIGIRIKEDDVRKVAAEIRELDNALAAVKARRAREVPALEQRWRQKDRESRPNGCYKDDEINRQERHEEFWGYVMICCILLLVTFCPPFRYLAYILLGVCALDALRRE